MTQDCNDTSRKFFRMLMPPAVIAVLLLLLYPNVTYADAVTSPLVFTRGSYVYLIEPQRIVFLSMDTRGAHTLYTAPDSMFNMISAVGDDDNDMVWISTNIGSVIALNTQTGTIEEYSRGLVAAGGYIGIDRRFVWVAAGDTLYRMDITSREWARLPSPGRNSEVRGLIATGDQVYVITDDDVRILTVVSGDWVVFPHRGFVLDDGDFRMFHGAAYFTRGKKLLRYDPSKRQWIRREAKEPILALNGAGPDLVLAVTGSDVYQFNTRNYVFERRPGLPLLRDIRTAMLHNGELVCVTGRGLANARQFGFDVVVYPDHVNVGRDIFAFSYFDHIMLYTNGAFVINNMDRRIWSGVRVVDRVGGERATLRQGWDEQGARFSARDDLQSSLSGTITAGMSADPILTYSEKDGVLIETGATSANGAVNVRTSDPYGRTLDLTLDNAMTTAPQQKGFYYKGIDGDILDRASFGLNGTGLATGGITPNMIAEGGSAVFSGKTKAENSNISVVSAAVGSGHIMTKTEWNEHIYNPSGVYPIYIDGTRKFVASGVRVYVDGVPLLASDFVYDPESHTVRLLRRDKADPASRIQISFLAMPIDSRYATLDIFPERHFGQYNFAEGVFMPRSWVGARAGVLTIDHGDGIEGPVAMAGMPVEWRNGAHRSISVLPEIAYDNRMGAHSAGVTIGVMEKNAFGSYRGMSASSGFSGIDRPTFLYGKVTDEHELTVGYDINRNLRTSWYQFHRQAEDSDISHFELRSQYAGTGGALPDIEMSVSSRNRKSGPELAYRDEKETFRLRLSDPSSSYLKSIGGPLDAGYDLAWTEIRYGVGGQRELRGRMFEGQASIMPVSSLMIEGSGMYRLNPHGSDVRNNINTSLSVKTDGLPHGLNIDMSYQTQISNFALGSNQVWMGRSLTSYIYPGEFADALDKLVFYLGYSNQMESLTPQTASPLTNIFLYNEHTIAAHDYGEFGVIYMPIENLLISSLNAISKNSGSPATLYSSDRIKFWFENGGSLEGNVGIGENPDWRHVGADVLYEHRWTGGFLAGIGVFGEHGMDKDSTVNLAGPQFVMSLTKDFSGYIRSVENSHAMRISLYEDDPSTPSMEYALYLRLKMPPNISLLAEIYTTISRAKTASVAAGMYLFAGF